MLMMKTRAPAAPKPPTQVVGRARWTLNGDYLNLAPNGVARYAREVVAAMDEMIGENDPLTRTLDIDLVSPVPFQYEHIPVRVVPEFKSPRLPQVWVQAQLPRHVPGGLVSFCNLGPLAVRRQIVCIHDLHTFVMPESYSMAFRLVHRFLLPQLGHRSAAVTTVSNFSRGHLEEFGVAPSRKITVTYNGSDHTRRWNASQGRLSLPTERPYVLCLGQPQRYKNIELILKLAPKLDALGIDVLMAGSISEAEIIERGGGDQLGQNLRLLGRINDDDFAQAFSNALCFVFPSRIEGFGLPVIEAMSLGCPVVSSTSPCLPEVCGDAASFADPDDPQAWADAIAWLRDHPEEAKAISIRGRARANTYAWREIAKTYFKLMASLDQADGKQVEYFRSEVAA